MVIDDEIDAIDEAAEIVRLHVDHRDPVVLGHRRRRDGFDVDVEQVDHAHVLGPGHALNRADDRRRFRAPQDVAQRQAAGHRVGVRFVVQQDQHALGIAEIPLVLLHPGPRQRPAELRQQGTAEQFRHREIRDVRKLRAEPLCALIARLRADAEDVDERATGIADRVENFLRVAPAVVFDDDARTGPEVGFDPRFGASGIAGEHRDPGLVEPSRGGFVLDDELDFETGEQDFVQHPDHQLVLTHG